MKEFLFLCLVTTFIFLSVANGQSCGCANELDFVTKYYEANLPGFADNVTEKNRQEYEKFRQNLSKKAEKIKLKDECFKLLVYYVEFFRDNHSTISSQNKSVNEKDESSLKEFFASESFATRETFALKDSDLKQYPLEDVRGIYQTVDGTYTVAVIPNKGNLREYIGVIIESKTPLWKKGQVKFELNPNKNGGYEVFSYQRNHSLKYSPNFILNEGVLGDIWFKTSLENKISQNINVSDELSFKVLNDTTSYIRIPSFSGNLSALISEFYKKYEPEILTKPFLVIDVRNNGGGSDRNVYPLLKYIYTKPFKNDTVELYVTEGNIRDWEAWYAEISKDKVNYSNNFLKLMLADIDSMKKSPLNSFFPRGLGDNMVNIGKVLETPKKVAIITNKNCASSCETLLFWAKESDKTIIVGENSGGYVGYGEVGNINTPCFNFSLSCTKTRYRKQRQFELIGITPNYKLDNKSDWISQTVNLLMQGK